MRLHFIFEPDSPQRFRELGLLTEQLGFDAVWAPNILSARDPFLAFSLLASCPQQSMRLSTFFVPPKRL